MIQQQGRKSARNGRIAEQLMRAAEMFCERVRWNEYQQKFSTLSTHDLLVLRQPYTTIYGTRGHREFLLQLNRRSQIYIHDDDGMIRTGIEFKHQDVAGSVDEKLPYIIENFIESEPPLRNLWIVLTGSYWKSGRGASAHRYLIRKANAFNPAVKHLDVFMEDEVIANLRRLMNVKQSVVAEGNE